MVRQYYSDQGDLSEITGSANYAYAIAENTPPHLIQFQAQQAWGLVDEYGIYRYAPANRPDWPYLPLGETVRFSPNAQGNPPSEVSLSCVATCDPSGKPASLDYDIPVVEFITTELNETPDPEDPGTFDVSIRVVPEPLRPLSVPWEMVALPGDDVSDSYTKDIRDLLDQQGEIVVPGASKVCRDDRDCPEENSKCLWVDESISVCRLPEVVVTKQIVLDHKKAEELLGPDRPDVSASLTVNYTASPYEFEALRGSSGMDINFSPPVCTSLYCFNRAEWHLKQHGYPWDDPLLFLPLSIYPIFICAILGYAYLFLPMLRDTIWILYVSACTPDNPGVCGEPLNINPPSDAGSQGPRPRGVQIDHSDPDASDRQRLLRGEEPGGLADKAGMLAKGMAKKRREEALRHDRMAKASDKTRTSPCFLGICVGTRCFFGLFLILYFVNSMHGFATVYPGSMPTDVPGLLANMGALYTYPPFCMVYTLAVVGMVWRRVCLPPTGGFTVCNVWGIFCLDLIVFASAGLLMLLTLFTLPILFLFPHCWFALGIVASIGGAMALGSSLGLGALVAIVLITVCRLIRWCVKPCCGKGSFKIPKDAIQLMYIRQKQRYMDAFMAPVEGDDDEETDPGGTVAAGGPGSMQQQNQRATGKGKANVRKKIPGMKSRRKQKRRSRLQRIFLISTPFLIVLPIMMVTGGGFYACVGDHSFNKCYEDTQRWNVGIVKAFFHPMNESTGLGTRIIGAPGNDAFLGSAIWLGFMLLGMLYCYVLPVPAGWFEEYLFMKLGRWEYRINVLSGGLQAGETGEPRDGKLLAVVPHGTMRNIKDLKRHCLNTKQLAYQLPSEFDLFLGGNGAEEGTFNEPGIDLWIRPAARRTRTRSAGGPPHKGIFQIEKQPALHVEDEEAANRDAALQAKIDRVLEQVIELRANIKQSRSNARERRGHSIEQLEDLERRLMDAAGDNKRALTDLEAQINRTNLKINELLRTHPNTDEVVQQAYRERTALQLERGKAIDRLSESVADINRTYQASASKNQPGNTPPPPRVNGHHQQSQTRRSGETVALPPGRPRPGPRLSSSNRRAHRHTSSQDTDPKSSDPLEESTGLRLTIPERVDDIIRNTTFGNPRDEFYSLDANSSGYVTFREFKFWLGRKGISLSPEAQKAMFRAFDPNDSGQITFDEFQSTLQPRGGIQSGLLYLLDVLRGKETLARSHYASDLDNPTDPGATLHIRPQHRRRRPNMMTTDTESNGPPTFFNYRLGQRVEVYHESQWQTGVIDTKSNGLFKVRLQDGRIVPSSVFKMRPPQIGVDLVRRINRISRSPQPEASENARHPGESSPH